MAHHVVTLAEPATISAAAPVELRLPLDVPAVRGVVRSVVLEVDVEHDDQSDLRLHLESPDGTRVRVTTRWSSSRRRLRLRFDPASLLSWEQTGPNASSTRPQGSFEAFEGQPAAGRWHLVVQDVAPRDGGVVHSALLEVDVADGGFRIDLDFESSRNDLKRVFERAARRWEQVIVGDLPGATVDGSSVDDVLIRATVERLDGPGGVLGRAGPTHTRFESGLPLAGVMKFDADDLDAMLRDGSLEDVILHEMGHVLGLGTLWRVNGLVVGAGTEDPRYVGENAVAAAPGAFPGLGSIPLANTGGAGTREGHWREKDFGAELMTGYLSGNRNPLSAMTIGALEDLGYDVDYAAAEALAPMQLLALSAGPGRKCRPSAFYPRKVRCA